MKLYTTRIYYPEGTKEEEIPASDFGMIESLYSIFKIKVEMIKEEELPSKRSSKRKSKK